MGISVSKQTTINVGADRLWSILADDFDKVGNWARAVQSSVADYNVQPPLGANVGGRVCQTPGFGAINETFTSFDAERRSYAFRASADKIPSFVRNITNHTSVKAAGPDRSEVTIEVTADTHGLRGAMVKPMMTRKFGTTIDELLEDLRAFAESGQVSGGKTKALAKAGR